MKFNIEKFKQSLLDNETITTDEMELTIQLVSEFIENASLKNYEIFRNGTQQGTVRAKNLREAKNKVFASYGKELQVYLEEEDEDYITINKKIKNIKLNNTELRFDIEQGNLLNQKLYLFGKVYRVDDVIEYAIGCEELDQNYFYYSEKGYLQDIKTLRKVFNKKHNL